MENRKGTRLPVTKRPAHLFSIFHFLLSIFFFSAGCGAPGDPTPPSPPIPAAIADLAARQDGDGVQLSFTLPSKSISGERLASSSAVEILRGTLKTDGSPDSRSFRVVDTIPGALIDNYRSEDHLHFTDPIAPEETKAHPGGTFAYVVRMRVSQKRASADSNVVTVRVFAVPERIASVEARLSESAIELSWPAPVRSVIQVEGKELESSDSQPLTVTPHDTFPPAAPQGLVAALLPGPAPENSVVELSWSINLETDLAGYRVYRSEQESTRGQLLN